MRHDRFIPTRVGNAAPDPPAPRSASVHPHAGGERCSSCVMGSSACGSSPRGWGTLKWADGVKLRERFIPTRVGNACSDTAARPASAVHPHAGGERALRHENHHLPDGSSPRGWGTLLQRVAITLDGRFIPTRVGNAPARLADTPSTAVHPHAGGERSSGPAWWASSPGSSPRGWGTRSATAGRPAHLGFIPTRVGNAAVLPVYEIEKAVHPHAGGERVSRLPVARVGFGSSPRGWGTRLGRQEMDAEIRFIPTRVGNAPILSQ